MIMTSVKTKKALGELGAQFGNFQTKWSGSAPKPNKFLLCQRSASQSSFIKIQVNVRYVVSSRDSREKQTNRQSRKQQWSHTSGFLAQKIKVIKRDILSKSVGALCHHVDEKVEINFLAHNHTWLQFAQRLLLPSLLLLILLSSFSDQLLILVTFFPALFCCSPCCNQSPNRREMKWEWEQLIKYSHFHLSSLE